MAFPREEIARILETVAKDGLPGPRDLDVALDAIACHVKPDAAVIANVLIDHHEEVSKRNGAFYFNGEAPRMAQLIVDKVMGEDDGDQEQAG